MPRMKILSAVEQEAFESPPVFNSVQRKHHFDFSLEVRQLAATLRTPTNQLGFLLSWGYFTATKQFFPPQAFRPPDAWNTSRSAWACRLIRRISPATTNKPWDAISS